MKNYVPISKISLLAIMMATTTAYAQNMDDVSVEVGVSTLGTYFAPGMKVNDNLNLRAPIYLFSGNRDFDSNSNNIESTMDVKSFSLMADYYPFQSGLRVSAGLAFGGYSLNSTITDPTIDGTTFNGEFKATLEQSNQVAPVFAVGYQYNLTQNWGMVAELGARFSDYELTTTGQDLLPDPVKADFNSKISDINEELEGFGTVPFVALGITYRF